MPTPRRPRPGRARSDSSIGCLEGDSEDPPLSKSSARRCSAQTDAPRSRRCPSSLRPKSGNSRVELVGATLAAQVPVDPRHGRRAEIVAELGVDRAVLGVQLPLMLEPVLLVVLLGGPEACRPGRTSVAGSRPAAQAQTLARTTRRPPPVPRCGRTRSSDTATTNCAGTHRGSARTDPATRRSSRPPGRNRPAGLRRGRQGRGRWAEACAGRPRTRPGCGRSLATPRTGRRVPRISRRRTSPFSIADGAARSSGGRARRPAAGRAESVSVAATRGRGRNVLNQDMTMPPTRADGAADAVRQEVVLAYSLTSIPQRAAFARQEAVPPHVGRILLPHRGEECK